MVHVCDCALAEVRLEIGTEPLLLRRARVGGDVRVQCNHVPRTEVVAVVAARTRTGLRPEVIEVRRRTLSAVLVIADRRTDARAVPSPRGIEAGDERMRILLAHIGD